MATTHDQGRQRPGRDGLGPDHPDRRQPRHLHQDRLRPGQGRGVPQHVVDLPRLQHLHEGQGPARRALHHQPHLRHLRRQPRHLLLLRAEHGLRRASRRTSGEWIVNLGEAAEYMFDHNIFQENLVGVDFCEKMVAETNPGVLEQAEPDRGAARRRPRLQDHRRHHAVAQPVLGRVLPRGAAGEPLHARDVLPDGGTPRPPLDALPGRRRHDRDDPALHRLPHAAHALRRVHEAGRARCTTTSSTSSTRRCPATRRSAGAASLLGCWGAFQDPDVCNFNYRDMTEWGRAMYVTPGRGRRRQAGHQRPGRHQPRHPHPARQLVLRRLGGPGDVRHPRPARQPGRPPPPVEPAHQSRNRRSATSTSKYSWVMSPRWFDGTDHLALDTGGGPLARLWSTALSGLVDIGYVKATGHSVRDQPAPDRARSPRSPSSGRSRSGRNTIERDRARTYFQAYAAAAALDFVEKALAEVRAGQHQDLGAASRCPTRASAAGSPRRCAACCRTTW